jgi:hypothetical protein
MRHGDFVASAKTTDRAGRPFIAGQVYSHATAEIG